MKGKFILVDFSTLDVKGTCQLLWSLQKGFEKMLLKLYGCCFIISKLKTFVKKYSLKNGLAVIH